MPATLTYASPMVQTPLVGIASVTTALTARGNITGTTGLTQLTVLDANQPHRVDQIDVQATATTAACLIWIWMYDGTTAKLLYEIPMVGTTGSSTVAGDTKTVTYLNLRIPAGWQLYASVTVTQNMNVFAHIGKW